MLVVLLRQSAHYNFLFATCLSLLGSILGFVLLFKTDHIFIMKFGTDVLNITLVVAVLKNVFTVSTTLLETFFLFLFFLAPILGYVLLFLQIRSIFFLWNFVVMPLVLIQRLRNFKKFFLACLLPSKVVLGYSFSQYWVTGTFLRYVSLFLQNIPLVLNISHKNFYRWMFLVLLWKLKYWKIFFMPCLFLLVVMLEYFEIN